MKTWNVKPEFHMQKNLLLAGFFIATIDSMRVLEFHA